MNNKIMKWGVGGWLTLLVGSGALGFTKPVVIAAQKQGHKNQSKGAATLNTSSIGGFGARTTGGMNGKSQVFSVTSTDQLRRALQAKPNAHRVIMIKASLDGNDGQTASDYAIGTGYDLHQYLTAYDPNTFGKHEPTGPQENARKQAAQKQKHHVVFDVPNNTSIIGAKGVTLSNINFMVNANNVSFKNLSMIAPVDDFPQWDPRDGDTGNWNSQYDAISLKGATNVLIDHCRFADGRTNDAHTTTYYGRQYQHHDGLVDITDGSDDVTVSNNVFANHDKTMLIGSSDSDTGDRGKLHVSILDNYFLNTTQRMPRVRYGTVEVINNYFRNHNRAPYPLGYVVGAGDQATLLVSHNVADLTKNANHFIQSEGAGAKVTRSNNLINGHLDNDQHHKSTLSGTKFKILATNQVKQHVLKNAGPLN